VSTVPLLASVALSLPLFLAAAAVAAAWWLAMATLLVVRRPPRVRPTTGDAGLDLPDEPPAVAGLLANDFMVPGEVAPAIVLDLAARGALDLDEVQPGRTTCRLRDPGGATWSAYEHRVLAELGDKAIDGVVPTDALTTGPEDQSERWHRVLAQEIVDDAHARGLTFDRWPKRILAPLGIALFAVVALLVAGLTLEGDASTDRPVLAAVAAAAALVGFVAGIVLIGRLGRSLAQLPTATGRVAAARADALARQLWSNPVIGELPPAGVKLWDRLFAYAAAFGAASRAVALLPMGAEDDHRAWSRAGGRWRRVRVRYPRAFPSAWGKHPLLAVALALFWGGVAGVVAYGLRGLSEAERPAGIGVSAWGWVDRGALLALVPCGVTIAWALWLLARAVPDLWQTRTVTGEVVRERRFQQWFASGNEPRYWYYEAVDDGTADRVVAWRVSELLWRDHAQGELVTAEVTPRLGYVRTIRPG
jgi:hypothetical protein